MWKEYSSEWKLSPVAKNLNVMASRSSGLIVDRTLFMGDGCSFFSISGLNFSTRKKVALSSSKKSPGTQHDLRLPVLSPAADKCLFLHDERSTLSRTVSYFFFRPILLHLYK